MKYENEFVGPNAPRTGNALTRWIGDVILKMMGWKLVGKFPDVKQVILIGGPHTSNWDLPLVLGCTLSVGLKFSWMMKKEAFFWPVGGLWKALGGIPIDRNAKTGVVDQMKDYLSSNEKVWLGLTPEGTRSKVETYKTGYLRIAYATGTPVFLVGVDAVNKSAILDKFLDLTGDLDADNAAIKAYVDATYNGMIPERS